MSSKKNDFFGYGSEHNYLYFRYFKNEPLLSQGNVKKIIKNYFFNNLTNNDFSKDELFIYSTNNFIKEHSKNDELLFNTYSLPSQN